MEKITYCHLSSSCFSFVLTVARYAFELTEKQSAQQSNEICLGSNDRFGIKIPTDFAYGAKLSGYIN